jgi:RNA polymerase sigma-70 factor (ECF subfamily)
MLAKPSQVVAEGVHETLLAEFLRAAGSGNVSSLAKLLAEDVVMRGDGGSGAPALKRPLRGRLAVARFVIASRALLPRDAVLSIGPLNGTPAATFHVDGRRVLALLIECTAEYSIGCVFAISNPEKLRAPMALH